MIFTIYSTGENSDLANAYFTFEVNEYRFSSPLYSDKSTCISQVEQLILRLRDEQANEGDFIITKDKVYVLSLFGDEQTLFANKEMLATKSIAQQVLNNLIKAAQAEEFKLRNRILSNKDEPYSPHYDLELSADNSTVYDTPAIAEDPHFSFSWVQKEGHYFYKFDKETAQSFLLSKSYGSETSRQQGLKRLLNSAQEAANWQALVQGEQYYLTISSGKGEELARSCFFADYETAVATRDQFVAEIPFWIDRLKQEFTQKKTRDLREVDNYLLNRVADSADEGIESFSEIIDEKEQYFFQINKENGESIFYGEAYQTKEGRDNGISSVLHNAANRDQFVIKEEGGYYYYTLLAKNHQEIGRSNSCASIVELEAQIVWLQEQSKVWSFIYNLDICWETGEEEVLTLKNKREIPPVVSEKKEDKTVVVAPPLSAKNPCAPLFHLFKPYAKSEGDQFFGRDEEIEELYQKTFDTDIVLVYGADGVGKTSLIQCGLANRNRDNRWQAIPVSREKGDINESLLAVLREAAEEAGSPPLSEDCDAIEALRALYKYNFKPIYLLVDQLEELFTAFPKQEEQQQFFSFLQKLSGDVSLPVKVILSIQEKYLAQLTSFEPTVPELFEHRYQLQAISSKKIKTIISGMLTGLEALGEVALDNADLVISKISNQLTGNCPTVGGHCVQIYLDQLQQRVCSKSKGGPLLLTAGLIDSVGDSKTVVNDFLDDKITALEKDLPTAEADLFDNEQAREIERLVGMKHQCNCGKTKARNPWFLMWFQREEKKPLAAAPWLLWLSLLGLIASVLAFAFMYGWIKKQDPCEQARQADSDAAYINYLCQQGEGGTCAMEFTELLNQRQSQVWVDYQQATQLNTCEAYRSYIETYKSTGVCTDVFYQKIYNSACPSTIQVDTLIVEVRDTISEEVLQPGYEHVEVIREKGKKCQLKDGENFRNLGPLLIMTENLGDGNGYDWVSALSACRRQGFRLPCAGELEYLLRNYYTDSLEAYVNLASGECSVFEGLESQDFWTATESNDDKAWTLRFDPDPSASTVTVQSDIDKNTLLPCRCVIRVEDWPSGIPICYEKEVYRRVTGQ